MPPDEKRVALVTGAGSGIGRATARRLAATGYRVTLAGRRDVVAQRIGRPDLIPYAGRVVKGVSRGSGLRMFRVGLSRERAKLVRAAAADQGRPSGAVEVSTQIIYAAFGDHARVQETERELCRRWARIPEQQLDRSAYLLLGEPAQMAEALQERQQAYGLSRITIMAEPGLDLAPPDPLRFCREVVPLP